MQTVDLIWGILSLLMVAVGLVPFLGMTNWFNVPFAGLGAILCGIALVRAGRQSKGAGIAGLICCLTALIVGAVRLVLGAGIF